jgi:AcrR family transcriptional regulator
MATTARSTYRHGNLRDEALTVALQIVASDGRKALSLRRLADQLGVSHRALYRHFDDGDGLSNALAALGFDQLADLLATRRTRGDFVDLYTVFATRNIGLYEIMMSRSQSEISNTPDLSKATRRMIDVALDILTLPNDDDRQRQRGVMKIWMALHGAIMLNRSGILRARDGNALADELKIILKSDLEVHNA